MPIPIQTVTEKPSNSGSIAADATETSGSTPQPASSIPDQQSSIGITGPEQGIAAGGGKSEAEIAADKVYEERIEEEYAKREGGA